MIIIIIIGLATAEDKGKGCNNIPSDIPTVTSNTSLAGIIVINSYY